MSTQDNNSLEARINAVGMFVGNQVLASTGSPTTASRQLWVDSESRLSSGLSQPFALGANQSTITSELITLAGKATTDVMTTTVVAGASFTTLTKGGAIRVYVSDDNSVLTAGYYYIPLYTLS